jgi:RHS repeat-associated protein
VTFDPTQSQQQVILNGTQQGTYYILLHGREGSAGGQPYSITVQELPFQVLGVTPNHGSNAGQATLTIQGSQLSPTTAVTLVGQDGSKRNAAKVLFKDNTTLFATFDLTGLTPGTYDVQVADNGHTATDPGAFTVNAGNPGQVSVTMTSTAVLRPHQTGIVTIDYTNTGETDAPAPLLILSSDNASFQLPGQTTFVPDSIQLLGINQNGPAGVLPPGYHGTLTVTFLPKTFGPHVVSNFTLSTIASPDTPFDWNSVKSDLQPPSVPNSAWDAIFANFTAAVGTTLGQYQAVLGANATYLSQLGEYTPDVNRLLSFELQKAEDFGAITQRNTLGNFGLGWPDPTNIRAVTDSSGNVTIQYSGQVRSFFLQPDGSYQGVPGDAATLSNQSGAYVLRETDGTITAFNPDGTLNYTQDTNGNRITANYTSGQLTSFVDSTGDTVRFQYNPQGHISQVTDPVGRVTTYTYDNSGTHLLSVTDPSGTTSYTYVTGQGLPSENALASITFPDGTHLNFQYDAQGRLIGQSRDGGAEAVSYSYDTEGGVTVTDAKGGSSTYFLNEFGQVGKYQDPFGHFTTFSYDTNHNLAKEVGPGGITTTFSTDAAGNPVGTVDPQGNHLTATYDPILNRLQKLSDPLGNTTNYATDSNGNLLSITYPNGSNEQFTYDPRGNLTESVDGRAIPIQYTYDAHNLLTRKTFADGTHIDYAYDAHRNLISATDASGTTTFTYDSADRLTGVSYPNGMSLAFTYDQGGRRTKMVDQTGFTVNYQYDNAGRLSGLTDGNGKPIVTYGYDAAGRLSSKVMGNGTSTSYSYDAAGDVTSIVNKAPDGSVISRFDYAYDDQGRPTSVTTLQGKTTYGYDATGQLTSVKLPGGRTITYQYDAAGNRVAVTDSGVTTDYTTNNMDQYTTVGNTSYKYDGAGNLISQTDTTGVGTTYGYNDQGQLASVVSSAGTFTYQYDALGNRIVVTQNGQKIQYLIDPTGLGNVVGEFDGNGNAIAHYTQGRGLTSRAGATGVAAYYNFDLTGNTTELTGAGGTTLDSYAYLPFGEIANQTGALPNPFTFVGQFGVMSTGSGQYFMRNRSYDPTTGQFASNDPLGFNNGVANLRGYVGNLPTKLVDPTGQCYVVVTYSGGDILGYQEGVIYENNGNVYGFAGGEVFVNPLDVAFVPFGEVSLTYGSGQVTPGTSVQFSGTVGTPFFGVTGNVGYNFGNPLSSRSYNGEVGATGGFNVMGVSAAVVQTWRDPFGQGYKFPCVKQSALQLIRAHAVPGQQVQTSKTEQRTPGDPNDLTGPAGYGASGFITPSQTLPYTINFQNEPNASAPAQTVVITEQLAPSLDWSTFQVGNFTIAGTTYQVPAINGFYSTQIDLRSTLGILLDVSAGINLTTGVATWTFTSIDPQTGDVPANILTGFLPPDVTPPQGEAFVTYTVRPKTTDTTGTPIGAQASIVFDTNAPVATPQVVNTIDAGPPMSSVNPLPAQTPSTTFTVSWSGQDDPGGSGIANYDVFVSDNSGPFTLFQQGTTLTIASFTGQVGHTYGFYSVAVDNVGHRQATPTTAQASTTITNPPPALTSFTPPAPTEGSSTGTVTLATFTDADTNPADFSAVVSWGDGSSTTLTAASGGIAAISGQTGAFAVLASHTYADEGSHTLTVQVTDASNLSSATSAAVTVADAPQSGLAVGSFSGTEGTALAAGAVTVATFSDANASATPADFTAALTWGDGSSSTVSGAGIVGSTGSFSVLANHTYAETGSFTLAVQVHDDGGSTLADSGSVTVAEAPLTGVSVNPLSATEGQAVDTATVATFTDSNSAAPASDFTAVINWGDGSTSTASGTGIVAQGGGSFAVLASHVYAEEGSHSLSVQVSDVSGSSVSGAAAVSVADAPLTWTSLTPPAPTAGTPFSATFATFSDANAGAPLSDFTATLSWGDGSVSTLTGANGGGSFSIAAGHTYATAASGLTFNVTVADVGGASTGTSSTISVGSGHGPGGSHAPPAPAPAPTPPSPVPGQFFRQELFDLAIVTALGASPAALLPFALSFSAAQAQSPREASQLAFAEFALGMEMALVLSHPADAVFLTGSATGLNTSIIDNPLYATPTGFQLGLWSEAEALAMMSKMGSK